MNSDLAKYFIKLKPKMISSDLCGTKEQLDIIINLINQFNSKIVWYLADLETIPDGWIDLKSNHIPYFIGSTNDLINKLNNKYQNIFAIFICFNEQPKNKDWTRSYWSEDNEVPDLQGALLGIRPFDTSYYDIYSNNLKIMQFISKNFKCEIEYL